MALSTVSFAQALPSGGASSPPSEPRESLVGRTQRSFVELDERIGTALPGTLIVRAERTAHPALTAHLARRLRAKDVLTVAIANAGFSGIPNAALIAGRLGVELSTDVATLARALATTACATGSAIITTLPSMAWDRAVIRELARIAAKGHGGLVVMLVSEGSTEVDGMIFDVPPSLDAAGKQRWMRAMAAAAELDVVANELVALENWWAGARCAPERTRLRFGTLSEDARDALTCLALAGRPLDASAIARVLGRHLDPSTLEELVGAGVTLEGTTLALLREPGEPPSASLAMRVATAGVLGSLEHDPWALARAAELLVSAERFEEADHFTDKALRACADAQAADGVNQQWFATVARLYGDIGLRLRLRAADRALDVGEANDALRWCESASSLAPENAEIALLASRAYIKLGDLVAARVSLNKTKRLADDVGQHGEDAARVYSVFAEICYLESKLDDAKANAEKAIALATRPTTRLEARCTLGKVYLAEARWDAADAHFAEDSMMAASVGDVTSELRARMNRSIAQMLRGRLDEARKVLEDVVADAERLKIDRARAYAYSNLGVIAYRQHDYGGALAYWEDSIRFPNALCGRMPTALTMANLAELRLRLGLVEHAEHAVAFGRRLLDGRSSPARNAHFGRVAAQIALARKHTDAARREIDSALVEAELSGNREILDACLLVATRIALEDGELQGAAAHLERARELATTGDSRAEAAILHAHHVRAAGGTPLDAALEALSLARLSDDENLVLEAHFLLATIHRDSGDVAAAREQCNRAIAARDRVASGLSSDVRAAFLAKPETVEISRLHASLSSSEPLSLREPPAPSSSTNGVFDGRVLVGDDPQLRSLLAAIRKVARSSSTVLIRGESGTGKELVARALHEASHRASGPLVSVNCAALVETLLLSELFGHEKGAFTGASARRRGRFEMAEGGTLFLDEIGDITPRTQVALLRVLQEKTFERVGGVHSIRSDVRVVCATHRDLKAMVERGEFREDLYYRLRGVVLEVPTLRSRSGDIPKLVTHFLERIAAERGEEPKSASREALELLCRHRWPGNVRELENALRTASLFTDGVEISATDLAENIEDLRRLHDSFDSTAPAATARDASQPLSPSCEEANESDDGILPSEESKATAVAYAQVRQGAVSLSDIKRQLERDCIVRALRETHGHITKAAALLGMKRPRVSQLIKQHGISIPTESE